MTYTVSNPRDRAVVMPAFEGQTYTVPAGGELEVESHRAALTLVDYGCTIDKATHRDAVEAEESRRADEHAAAQAEQEGRARTTVGRKAPAKRTRGKAPAKDKAPAAEAQTEQAEPVDPTAALDADAVAAALAALDAPVVDGETEDAARERLRGMLATACPAARERGPGVRGMHTLGPLVVGPWGA